MSKVCCKNCKYFRKNRQNIPLSKCELYEHNLTWYDGRKNPSTKYEFCSNNNAYNNCSSFKVKVSKRSWWKFWAK